MTAMWKVEELSATALLKSSGGTMFTSTAWVAGIMKARALPNRVRIRNTGQTMPSPVKVKPSSSKPHSSCAARQTAMMLRRL
jgi:hypothetical protein